ncbi:efflux RND transporter periplasmic adaptor subunit [Mucilaginibacter sp.]|uniref:efflux RND transporter periplasmic adaptor subunit n=1 Tax=Mucilaginibacter sp. TaxID=1882438 RepID=UPI002CAD3AE8|nr:efflux RND transporter periplasmic adaptor subunit [Mucilaginibacter sp.]HTI61832.1 efflux RND transporter periplasmic adaptor subunit [Mucilaginibacter sp.]
MDRKIEKSRWNTKRIMTIAGITGIVLLVAGSIYFTSGKSKYNVPVDRITISEIKKGPFSEFIPVNGVVMPQTTIYLDAVQGGTVQEKYVEDGAKLKKGDPILKLSNTDVEISLANSENQVYNVQTQMQISKNNAAQNTVGKLQAMADAESAFKEAERLYTVDKKLYAQKAIGLQDYQIAENAYNYQLRKRNLTRQILKQDTALNKVQDEQAQEQYRQMKKSLELMRKEVADLTVRAPIDGQLTSLDAEIGQNKNRGEHLAQIDGFSGLKVRANVDEHYISRVFTGMTAYYPTDDKNYKLVVKKVFSSVGTGGTFQVDMMFVGEVPQGLRKGQTLQIRLVFSDEAPALLLPKGGFFQQTGGNWIFKVSDDGKTAYKVDIQLNRQNPDYFEVIRGLKPGDKVITSSYENYGDIQELVLQK